MRIKVLYFSSIKDKIKKSSEYFDVGANSTVSDLLKSIEEKYPDISDNLRNIMVAVNEQYADREEKLKEGDTVALIPPVSGG
ncbi:molybdopterin synthase sulfur carrier subunit [Persephonella hydrogeniphila]|uniref:Molybdopterin synthase sulfur carrier subunit n=1 Tax=Persephonella hydrogeniphila TaxID=198703 RepID=A0A285NNW1_9AQUI|nr:molybdopterin converting factor subunit 1 [Persephonella hydrogeniphila]SNZ09546.1 molybdopterin synthase sulfur carrier subunit [Persephonella hydrogeniphila]